MKHLAKIQLEFIKEARSWSDLSREEQKEYLKRHPKSKRRLTSVDDKRHVVIKQLKRIFADVEDVMKKHKDVGTTDTASREIIYPIMHNAMIGVNVEIPQTAKGYDLYLSQYALPENATKKQIDKWEDKLDRAAKDIAESLKIAVNKIRDLRNKGYKKELRKWFK